jgi:hypothetical protein
MGRPGSPRLTRTVSGGGGGGGGYPAGMRIAPPADDFMLTRTINNPNARYTSGGGGGGMSRDMRKSPLQGVKMSSNSHYASYSRGYVRCYIS